MKTIINRKDKNKIMKIKKTTKSKRIHNRAMILLLSAEGKGITEIARLNVLSEKGVKNIMGRYAAGGVELALYDRHRTGRPPTVTPSDKQRIAAKACTAPPEGRARWTVALLTEAVKKDERLPTTSRESVRQALHLHQIKPWREKMWCIPELNGEYIHRMEDVLDLYERPHNSERPVVCFDEKPIQLLNDGRPTIAAKLGNGVKKKDYEYKRKGTANVFCAVEPKIGRYITKVTKRRKKSDFAKFLNEIAASYPKATKIELVMDNLNTHNESSLTEYYGIDSGNKIWSRFNIHYTPKHASWLNQAEIAIGIYSRQCLGRDRIGTIAKLRARSKAWSKRANKEKIIIGWTFTKMKARQKFKYNVRKKVS